MLNDKVASRYGGEDKTSSTKLKNSAAGFASATEKDWGRSYIYYTLVNLFSYKIPRSMCRHVSHKYCCNLDSVCKASLTKMFRHALEIETCDV